MFFSKIDQDQSTIDPSSLDVDPSRTMTSLSATTRSSLSIVRGKAAAGGLTVLSNVLYYEVITKTRRVSALVIPGSEGKFMVILREISPCRPAGTR